MKMTATFTTVTLPFESPPTLHSHSPYHSLKNIHTISVDDTQQLNDVTKIKLTDKGKEGKVAPGLN
jgi:hypothetical protein